MNAINKEFYLGNPPKNYKERKSVGLFVLRDGSCSEIVRAKINKKGDVYIFYPQDKESSFHESFHASGAFHWREGREKHFPLLGKKDAPLAFRASLFELWPSPCFCFRKGRDLSIAELNKIIGELIRYTPNNIRKEPVVLALEEFSFYRSRLSISSLLKLLRIQFKH
ncbi:hypothetical protein KKC63_03145 [Patescibacteria group bacterium]|nr:hypothetical protein [Patescibacteria group bacterium]MBU4023466.1 hypothetical protein [Patescibacteria group bacterium]MBU4078177.1 hypothetical protein [Patescibacteria group bacterium]